MARHATNLLARLTVVRVLDVGAPDATPRALAETFRACPADRLFRRASSALGAKAFVRSSEEIGAYARGEVPADAKSVDRLQPARRGVHGGGRRAR